MAFERPLSVALDGFTLHAATRAGGLDDAGREALLKYILRPAVAQERVTRGPEGVVRIALEKAFSDGIVAVDLDPLSLLSRFRGGVRCLWASLGALWWEIMAGVATLQFTPNVLLVDVREDVAVICAAAIDPFPVVRVGHVQAALARLPILRSLVVVVGGRPNPVDLAALRGLGNDIAALVFTVDELGPEIGQRVNSALIEAEERRGGDGA